MRCPICGMTLEPMMAGAGDEEEQHEVKFASTQILDRARAHNPGADHRDGPCDSRTACLMNRSQTNRQVDRVWPNDAGRSLGGRLFLRPGLAVDRQPQSQYVYADRCRRRRGLCLQRRLR